MYVHVSNVIQTFTTPKNDATLKNNCRLLVITSCETLEFMIFRKMRSINRPLSLLHSPVQTKRKQLQNIARKTYFAGYEVLMYNITIKVTLLRKSSFSLTTRTDRLVTPPNVLIMTEKDVTIIFLPSFCR